MTAHDGLGSVRADRRKADSERTTQPPVVDVAEGRRLLARVDAHQPFNEADEAHASRWLHTNAPALLDAAEEVWELKAQVAEVGSLYRVKRAELSALKGRITALADKWEKRSRLRGDTHRHDSPAHAASVLRALLSSDGTAVRADDRAGEGS